MYWIHNRLFLDTEVRSAPELARGSLDLGSERMTADWRDGGAIYELSYISSSSMRLSSHLRALSASSRRRVPANLGLDRDST